MGTDHLVIAELAIGLGVLEILQRIIIIQELTLKFNSFEGDC